MQMQMDTTTMGPMNMCNCSMDMDMMKMYFHIGYEPIVLIKEWVATNDGGTNTFFNVRVFCFLKTFVFYANEKNDYKAGVHELNMLELASS